MRRRLEGELHWKLLLHAPITIDTTVTKCLWTDCNNLGIQIKKNNNNNWRVQIYESLLNVIFSILLLLPIPPCLRRKYFSQHLLVQNSPTIFLP
jgi:hypothetical protein